MSSDGNAPEGSTTVLFDREQDVTRQGGSISPEYAAIQLPGYRLISLLGEGGMGVVFLAEQERLRRQVAVKMLSPDLTQNESFLERLRREALTLASLSHPNIISCYDIVQGDSGTFLVMEYVPGKLSVRDVIRRYGQIPEQVAARILHDAASGLAYALEKGIIHRDVKPDNLLVVFESSHQLGTVEELFSHHDTRVMIVDFGLAKGGEATRFEHDTEVTRAGVIMGSPPYMAPEQALGKPADFRADIYALGATLFHLLTAEIPFDADTPMDTVRRKLSADLPDPATLGSHVSRECMAILERMTRRDPEGRYGD